MTNGRPNDGDDADAGSSVSDPFDDAVDDSEADSTDAGTDRFDDSLDDDVDADPFGGPIDDDIDPDPFSEPLGGEEPADLSDAFEAVDVEEVDTDAVWEELLGAEADAAAFDADPEGGATAAATASAEPAAPADAGTTASEAAFSPGMQSPQAVGDDDTALVDKRVYCQQCPHFSEPPAVHCTREGTRIVEVLEDGRFRLHNCPVVTEDGPDRNYLANPDS